MFAFGDSAALTARSPTTQKIRCIETLNLPQTLLVAPNLEGLNPILQADLLKATVLVVAALAYDDSPWAHASW